MFKDESAWHKPQQSRAAICHSWLDRGLPSDWCLDKCPGNHTFSWSLGQSPGMGAPSRSVPQGVPGGGSRDDPHPRLCGSQQRTMERSPHCSPQTPVSFLHLPGTSCYPKVKLSAASVIAALCILGKFRNGCYDCKCLTRCLSLQPGNSECSNVYENCLEQSRAIGRYSRLSPSATLPTPFMSPGHVRTLL